RVRRRLRRQRAPARAGRLDAGGQVPRRRTRRRRQRARQRRLHAAAPRGRARRQRDDSVSGVEGRGRHRRRAERPDRRRHGEGSGAARVAVPGDRRAARETRVQEQPQVCLLLKNVKNDGRSVQRAWRLVSVIAGAAALIVVWAAGAAAQRGAADGGRGNAPAQKPYVPVGTAAIAKTPDQFLGDLVTLTASVETVLSKSAFAIDQHVKNQPSGTPLLVVAPILNGAVEPGKYVTVAGELVKFDPAAINKAAELIT